MLKVLATVTRVAFGFALACLAAGLVTVLFVNTPIGVLAEPIERLPKTAGETFDLALLTATHVAIFAFVFVLIIAALAEWLAIRTLPYYLIAGVVISALGFFAQYSSEVAGQPTILNNYALKTFLTSGFFGGFVYWLAAGQFAGRGPKDAQTSRTDDSELLNSTVYEPPTKTRTDESDPITYEPATGRTYDSASLLNRLKFSRRAPLTSANDSDADHDLSDDQQKNSA